MSHTYHTYGDCLHIIETEAQNITLRNFCNPEGTATSEATNSPAKLRNTEYFGINASFFNASTDDKILNIAMQNGQALGTTSTDGTTNSVGSSVICWDRHTTRYYDHISNAEALSFSTLDNTWIQGGIGMWLGSTAWYSRVSNQIGPVGTAEFLDGASDRRTAMVLNYTNNKIYLIIANKAVTFEEFRTLIQAYLNISDSSEEASTTYKAIMLDGGRSSQLRAQNGGSIVNIPTIGLNARAVAQVITTT